MTSKVIGRRDQGVILAAIKSSWKRYLPEALLPDTFFYHPPAEKPTYSRSTDISYDMVRRCKVFLQELVTMGIDKCVGRKLILCPKLFEWYYDRTFPVLTDREHFAPVETPLKDYTKWIEGIYVRQGWKAIATFIHQGEAPHPYPLFKLKDILADCATVWASKGTCCRNRPISPNTQHWLRRVYRRCGSVLRFLCNNLPKGVFNIMSVNVLKPALLETEICGKRIHGKNLQWYKTTGDISNCYDELRHDRIVAAVKFWIHQIPILLGSRLLDRFSICKWNRKLCVRANDNTGGD